MSSTYDLAPALFWNQVALIVAGLPQTKRDWAKRLALWIVSLRHRLIAARGISVTWSRIAGLYAELVAINYSLARCPVAEAWILRASWRFKKSNQLFLDDFLPTPRDISECLGEQVLALSTHQRILRDQVQRAYERGKLETVVSIPQQPHPVSDMQKNEQNRFNRELLDAITIKADIIAERDALKNQVVHLENVVAQLRSQLRQYQGQ